MTDTDNPTIAWPVTLTTGSIAATPSDSLLAVSQSVARIGSLELGQITVAPFLGLPALEFAASTPDIADHVKQTIEHQEPDAIVTVLQTPSPGAGWEQLHVEVVLADRTTDVG